MLLLISLVLSLDEDEKHEIREISLFCYTLYFIFAYRLFSNYLV